MPVTQETAPRVFLVRNKNAVDIANNGAVASVNTDIVVEMVDGDDQYPLMAGDLIIGPISGFDTMLAGIAVQSAIVKSGTLNTITLRTTNPSAAGVDPPSIAAGLIQFAVLRR